MLLRRQSASPTQLSSQTLPQVRHAQALATSLQHLPPGAGNKGVAAGARVRNLASTRSTSVDNNTVSTGRACLIISTNAHSRNNKTSKHTASVHTARLERELVVCSADEEVKALVVVVLVRVGRGPGLAAALDVVVGRAAGGRDLGAGVACAAALYVAGLARLEGGVFNGGVGDDGGGEREGDGRNQGEDGEELHGGGLLGMAAKVRWSEGLSWWDWIVLVSFSHGAMLLSYIVDRRGRLRTYSLQTHVNQIPD